MYDTIIIGSGPAGMTAGIYASRREMKTLIIGREVGGQIALASEIENYPGFSKVSAFELISKMKQQTLDLGVEIKESEVKQIVRESDGSFSLYTSTEKFSSRTVIIAMGLSPRRLAVPGELELAGKGVSYCANCDGPFYKGKVVAVIGGGNAALDAAEIMSKIAKQVYLVHRSDTFRAFDVLVDEVKARENIRIIMNADIQQISGQGKVESIKIKKHPDESEEEIALDGVFVEIGRIAHTDLVGEFAERNDKMQLIVNARCETKTPGIFAAGDVTDCEYKQITVAAGQGTIAALSAYQYLQLHKK